jgi:hypothetical protein
LVPAFGAVKKLKPKAKPKAKVTAVKKAVVAATVEATAKVGTVEASTAEAKVARKPVKFKDLTSKHPAYSYVMKMVADYGVISGYPDGTFKGKKTINRAEFCKIMTAAIDYLEKKYDLPMADEPATLEVKFRDLPAKNWAYPYVAKLVSKYRVFSGYPDGTFRPSRTINRYEMSLAAGKVLRTIFARCEISPEVKAVPRFKDIKAKHWALQHINLLVSYGILSKERVFGGNKAADRYTVAIVGARMIDVAVAGIDGLGPQKLAALRKKYGPAVAAKEEKPVAAIAKAAAVTRQAFLTSGWGNVYEGASGTNNWLGANIAGTYADAFKIWMLSGNYELSGKYAYNQIVYFVPSGGGGVSGGINNENRYELELNTTYPVVRVFGISGKLLLGAKYINLSNPTAPTNFTGFNTGLVTTAKVFGRDFLLRGFYSLPLARSQVSPSVMGQPAHLIDYEASIDANIFNTPLLLGFQGETMNLSGGFYRYYNMVFARYYLF